MATAEEKLDFLSSTKISDIDFEDLRPDAKSNWINLTDNDWDNLLPIADKTGKVTQSASQDRALFRLMSNGLQTKRDDWVYDFDRDKLKPKMEALIKGYERARLHPTSAASNEIKWDRELSRHLARKTQITFESAKIVGSDYRPFTSKYVYFDRILNSQSFRLHRMYVGDHVNPTIAFLSVSSANPLACLAVSGLFDTCLLKMGNGSTQGFPRISLDRADHGAPRKHS